ncbi:MAG TPA: hypothetical protein VGD80_14125 [Kofleriaceae bacterium]
MMQRRPAVDIRHLIWICMALSACFRPSYDHTACGPGGTCPEGFTCRNQFCESGNPPDDASIDASVDASAVLDAPPDAPPDAAVCFGSFVNVCLQVAPSAPVVITSPTTIDTSISSMCMPVASGTDACVLAGTTISITATLRAIGPRPLVLLASESITIGASGSVDVASHRGAVPETGAAADFTGCPAGTAPGLRAGGAGGSFTGAGGTGGMSVTGGNGGVPGTPIVGPVTGLRGGCSGQDGDGSMHGNRGHGGGAVLLIAVGAIDHAGVIIAAGEGGTGASANASGAGGGGAGGMIVLDAPAISGSGLILANGGGGGEGAGNTTPGENGADPTGTGPALGGDGPTGNGGRGGNGSAGAAGGPGSNGVDGTSQGGGGGGGGGAGVIRAPSGQDLGPAVSPAVTPF